LVPSKAIPLCGESPSFRGSSSAALSRAGGENRIVDGAWPWAVLFLLGCYHGINPGMGWLFAVALGLQERSARAVVGALPPIVLGHAVSIGLIVLLAELALVNFSQRPVRILSAILLFAFGAYRLVRARHPSWVGMRVGFWGLVFWAFLMASGHGAGLMLLPIITSPSMTHMGAGAQMGGMANMAMGSGAAQGLASVAVHTLGYLLTMTLVALLVYYRFGVAFLRTRWFNLDLVWAAALVVTGAILLVV
jgi:hypothetical protein